MAVTQEVIELVRRSRENTVILTDQQVIALTTAWVNAWDVLEPEFNAAILEVLGDRADTVVSASQMQRSQRLNQALTYTRQELDNLTQQAGEIVTNDIQPVVLGAMAAHIEILQSQLPPVAPGITLGRLRDDEIAAIVARTTQQIHSATQPLAGHVEQIMKDQLVRGQVVGANPRVTARKIVQQAGDGFYGGLSRAATIARTETLDAHRVADHLTAIRNVEVTDGWQWMATLDARSCGACLSMHGQRFPNDESGPDGHQQCRCTRVQVTKSWQELGFTDIDDTGIDLEAQRDAWFDNLVDDTQRQILGPGKYKMWQDGEISWGDLAKKIDNPGWRPSYVETPLKDLVA